MVDSWLRTFHCFAESFSIVNLLLQVLLARLQHTPTECFKLSTFLKQRLHTFLIIFVQTRL